MPSFTKVTGLNPFTGLPPGQEPPTPPPPPPPPPADGDLNNVRDNIADKSPTDFGNFFEQFKGQLQDIVPGLFATSTDLGPQVSGNFLNDLEKAREAREKAIRGDTAQQVAQARETGERKIGGIEEIQAGATRGQLGLSTILQENITKQETDTNKRIDNLNKAMQQAIATNDFETVKLKQAQINRAEDRADKLAELKLNTLFQTANLSLQSQQEERLAKTAEQQAELAAKKFGFDVTQFEAGESRFERTQGLIETKFARDISDADRATALENVARMANARIGIESLTDEEITGLEVASGLESGTFEAIYSRMLEDVERGDTISDLEIEKLKADIALTRHLASGDGTGVPSVDFATGVQGLADTFVGLQEQGQLFDVDMDTQISKFMDDQGIPPERFDEVKNNVEQQMAGIAGDVPSSDFATQLSEFRELEPEEKGEKLAKKTKELLKRGEAFTERQKTEFIEGTKGFLKGLFK